MLAALLAVGLPPEVHAASGPVVAALLAAGLLAAAWPGRPGTAGGHGLSALPVFVGLGLAGVNLAVSLAPGATVSWLADLALAAGAFALAIRLGPERMRGVLPALAAMGAVLAGHGLWQAAGGLGRAAVRARELGFDEAVVTRLSQGRAFATHLLPASLAGALVLSIAAAGACWSLACSRRGRLLSASAGAMAVCGLVATGSVGGWLALAAGGAALLVSRDSGITRRHVVIVVAGALVLLVLVAAVKPGALLDLDHPNHPLTLRVANWVGAAGVAFERPFAGTGLGSFGSLYPHVRAPSANETVYAHNSWLQLAVEGGLPVLVLLCGAAWALWRGLRRRPAGAAWWGLAATLAFAAHNLVDFTAFLPGVAVPAMMLAGVAFARERDETDAVAERRWGGPCLAVILVAAAGVLGAEAMARSHLERAQDLDRSGAKLGAADAALAASRPAPWLRPVQVQAAGLMTGGHAVHRARALEVARDLAELDPQSPAPWHLLANLALARGEPILAWRMFEAAGLRHPADDGLRESVKRLEDSFYGAGLLEGEFDYGRTTQGGPGPLAVGMPGPDWDDLLLAIACVMAALLAWRWWKPGPAPAAAFALALAMLLAGFGDGGALPGARLGWMLLVLLGAAAAVLPRRNGEGEASSASPGSWDPRPVVALLPALVWAGLSAAAAPVPAAARDGWSLLLASLLAIVLSAHVARRFDGWCLLAVSLTAVVGGMQLVLVAAQRAGAWLGFDPVNWWEPFAVARSGRFDGDFLHPGHLGTYLVAAGLGLVARGVARRGRASWILGGVFILAGLSQGARASILALVAGGTVLTLLALDRRWRVWVVAVVGMGGMIGAAFAAARLQGDPYAWSRLKIWRASFGALAERLWLGFGPGGFAPLGPAYAPEDPGRVARFAKVFRQPHSDLLDAFVSLGLVGGLALLAGLAWLAWRATRHDRRELDGPVAGRAAAWTVLAALASGGLMDGFLGERPIAGLTAAVLLGALVGPALRTGATAARRPGVLGKALAVSCLLTALLGAEFLPWVAYRVDLAGRPRLAARIDPVRARYWLEAARQVDDGNHRRVALAMAWTEIARLAAGADSSVWIERARVMDAACRGLLAERNTCDAARAAWSAVIARNPVDVFARRARARLDRAVGPGDAALTDLQLALAIEPRFLGARADAARILAEEGDLPAARQAFGELVAMVRELDGVTPSSPRERELLAIDPREVGRLSRMLAPGDLTEPSPEAESSLKAPVDGLTPAPVGP